MGRIGPRPRADDRRGAPGCPRQAERGSNEPCVHTSCSTSRPAWRRRWRTPVRGGTRSTVSALTTWPSPSCAGSRSTQVHAIPALLAERPAGSSPPPTGRSRRRPPVGLTGACTGRSSRSAQQVARRGFVAGRSQPDHRVRLDAVVITTTFSIMGAVLSSALLPRCSTSRSGLDLGLRRRPGRSALGVGVLTLAAVYELLGWWLFPEDHREARHGPPGGPGGRRAATSCCSPPSG